MSILGRNPTCQACRDLDSSCPVCDGIRATAASRELRREEAIGWIDRNLAQKRMGQNVICLPQDPEDVIALVMAIIAYAREPKTGESPEPERCERFQRIEFRDGK